MPLNRSRGYTGPSGDFEHVWLAPKTSRLSSTPFLVWAVDMGDHWHGYRETARWKGDDKVWKKADWDAVAPPPNADELTRPEPRPEPGPLLTCKSGYGCIYRISERKLDRDPDFCEEHQPERNACDHGVSLKLTCELCLKLYEGKPNMRKLPPKRPSRR